MRRHPNVILHHATDFHERHLNKVVGCDIFLRGVRLAIGLVDYEDDDEAEENSTFRLPETEEVDTSSDLLQQTKGLKVTILVTACAAITQGWQQSTINVSSRRWQADLQHDGSWEDHQLLAGLIDAAPWLSGSLIGTWLSDPLQEAVFGRRAALFASSVFCTAFAIATAHSRTWKELLVFRVLLGIGIGAKASVAPVFAAESAVDHSRGRLLMMWQLFDAFGIFVGFVCDWVVDMNWRVHLGTAAVPTLILLFLVFLSPESPRFYIRKGQYQKAFQSLRHLRGSEIQACRDLYYIHSQLQFESQKRLGLGEDRNDWLEKEIYQAEEIEGTTFAKRVWALWSNKRNRRACLAAFIVMAAQQLCGVNVLAFYSSALFAKVGEIQQDVSEGRQGESGNTDPNTVAWLNFGFGLANFLFTIPAYRYIDGSHRKGRRLLLLVSLAGMFVTLVAISSFYLIPSRNARLGLISVSTIVFFLLFYGIGAGPVPFTFSAEVFPLAFREVGMSFSVMINFLGLGLLVLFVPEITRAFGDNGNSYLLGLDALAFVLVFLFVPSTGWIPLEDMDYIFERSTFALVKEHFAAIGNLRRTGAGQQEDLSMGDCG
ncbi:general substrate transporter [Aspergillus karnatakaensis]|uniref:general substrate transporter n=1 Tax=Aspergillus karnatakaensis TaxID=1810916 RepID=UPI003CCDAB27